MAPPPSPVRILAAGAALTVASVACADKQRTSNPPPPEVPRPPENPPPPEPAPAPSTAQSALPAWDDVESTHPKGATNPPIPVLEVTPDGSRCFKAWQSPMVRDPKLMAVGGRVVPAPDKATGTEVQCEGTRASEVIARNDKYEASGGIGTPPKPGH